MKNTTLIRLRSSGLTTDINRFPNHCVTGDRGTEDAKGMRECIHHASIAHCECLSVGQSVCVSVLFVTHFSEKPYNCYICKLMCLSVRPFVSLSVCLSCGCLCRCLSVYLYNCPSVCLTPVCLSVCLYVRYVCIYISPLLLIGSYRVWTLRTARESTRWSQRNTSWN